MQIKIDNDWMIEVDKYNNHTPYRWEEICKRDKETRDMIPTGEYDWRSSHSHYASVEQCLRLYILPKMLSEGVDTTTLTEYHNETKRLIDYFSDRLGGIVWALRVWEN